MKKENYASAFNEYLNETGYTEDLTEENFHVPAEAEYVDFGEDTEDWDIAEAKPGLWENIRKKKERIKRGSGEKMRKKGDKGAPTAEQMERAKGSEKSD